MGERPVMPPLLQPLAVTPDLDPFERARQIATEGAEAGTVLWSIGQDACQAAVVLAPEHSLEASLPVALVTMLGLGDALGALLPPVVSVTFGWPDRIEVNGAVVGGVRMAVAPTEAPRRIPDWLVVGYGIARAARVSGVEPGERPDRTTLADEGCEIACMDLLEAFARHFLAWINRWQEDGFGPVRQAWLSRAAALSASVEVGRGAHKRQGIFTGLTDSGSIRLVKNGITQTISLEEAMKAPSWTL
jgi:BirA family transcriptional regulator, biotin operon repressor / biotin---[acetyl-CoA-carboxylase] ligase